MEIYNLKDNLPRLNDCYLTMGTFDGCHIGHQKLFSNLSKEAKENKSQSVLITFNPHPRHIIQKEKTFPIIMGLEKKIEIFQLFNINHVLIIPFDYEFSKMKADNFISDIIINFFKPKKIIIGYDHHFGFNREGTPKFLIENGKNKGFKVDVINPIKNKELIVSSSKIRSFLNDGRVKKASTLLGRNYGFLATIQKGSGRGRGLGFPTANFISEEKNQLIPSKGVYLISAMIHGNNLYGMCNLGVRPTFNETEFVMEAHFFDLYDKNIYGEKLEIKFLNRIRDEIKFSNSKELIKQLKKDKEDCIRMMQGFKQET